MQHRPFRRLTIAALLAAQALPAYAIDLSIEPSNPLPDAAREARPADVRSGNEWNAPYEDVSVASFDV